MQAYGYLKVTSEEIARLIGLSSSRIRDDLRSLGIGTDSRRGYRVDNIERQLLQLLGADRGFTTVMLGTERLGMALAANELFTDCGIRLTFVIESEAFRAGDDQLSVLKQSLSDTRADIAIINDRRFATAACCHCLEEIGFSGVWNITDQEIIPEGCGMAVENTSIGDSFGCLAYRLLEYRESRREENCMGNQEALDMQEAKGA